MGRFGDGKISGSQPVRKRRGLTLLLIASQPDCRCLLRIQCRCSDLPSLNFVSKENECWLTRHLRKSQSMVRLVLELIAQFQDPHQLGVAEGVGDTLQIDRQQYEESWNRS